MKKSILIVAAVVLSGISVAIAQEKKEAGQVKKAARVTATELKSPEEMAGIKTNRLDKTVTLSNEQRAKVYNIYLQEAKDHQNRAAERAQIQKQLAEVLDADQVKKMEAAAAERRQMAQKRAVERRDQKNAPGKIMTTP
jgi:protein CpxP